MAGIRCPLAVVLLMVLTSEAQEKACTFPMFMYEAPGWDTGVRSEGRSSGSFIIFEEDRMVSIDYQNWDDPELQSLCVTNVGPNKTIVSFPTANNATAFKCIQYVKRSDHVVQILESESSSTRDNSLCDDDNLILNDWPLVWASIPDEYQTCGFSGGFEILDIHIPSRDQHFCEGLSLPPRIESECQFGEGITLNFRYPQCVSDVNMPIFEVKFQCLGSWIASGYRFTVITDGASFLPGLWLMRFPEVITDDFYIDFVKDIVADRAANVSQTTEYLRWRLVRKVYPSLCEDESSDCSNCDEDGGFYCQKTCEICDRVAAQQRCSFDRTLRGEWVESSWSGTRTTRLSSSLLYPPGLSPFECFVIGGEDSLDWLEVTGRQTLVSLHKNGCRPRYACVAINSINPVVIQYRLSQSIVWPHSQTPQAEDICDYNQFQDDSAPLGSTYRSQYEKYLVRRTSPTNRRLEACDLNHNLVFTVVLNNHDQDTCVGTLKQCPRENHTLVLHAPGCRAWKAVQTLNCLSSTVEMQERFLLLQDPAQLDNIFCLASSTEPNHHNMFFLHASDCHVNVLVTIEHGQFDHYIAKFESAVPYNGTEDCTQSDIEVPKPMFSEPPIEQETTTAAETTTTAADKTTAQERSTLPQFSGGYDVTTTEKQVEATTDIPEDETTASTLGPRRPDVVTPPSSQEDTSAAQTASPNMLLFFAVIFVLM